MKEEWKIKYKEKQKVNTWYTGVEKTKQTMYKKSVEYEKTTNEK